MAHVLVTGGAGFIGSHLVERLLSLGERVSIIDSFDDFYDPAVKRRNIESALTHAQCRLYEGDIRDPAALEAAWVREPIDIVVHLAARAGVRPSIKHPTLYADVNVIGTVKLLEEARKHKCRGFIFASSSSVYGNNKKIPFHEDDRVDHPISPYAATKKAGEEFCYTYHQLYDLPMTCLRFFTVYGARCRPDLAVAKFTRLIDEGKPITMYGDGSMRRDFTYIDDIIDGVVRAIQRCGAFQVYNLGESQPIVLRDMIATIAKAVGKEPIIERQPQPPGDVDVTYADVSRARKELAYNPRTPFAEGIARYVAWFQESHAATVS
ncbi:MAG: NAD-dependent epimerase/dehydratase family protein [Phycisphaerales bacterium]|nr:NAD-dependent epimerase/dehydratase family protein [Phycisphaerales bacterium]